MNRAIPVVGVLLVGSVVAGALLLSGVLDQPAQVQPAPESKPAVHSAGAPVAPQQAASGSSNEVQLPPEATRKYPPGTFVPLTLPKVKSGIRLPDGSYLPLLNGVPRASPISRAEWLGPVPPVVGKQVDAEGVEWWVHADGSSTTTRWTDTWDAKGNLIRNIRTDHAAKTKDGAALPGPDAPAGSGDKSTSGNKKPGSDSGNKLEK